MNPEKPFEMTNYSSIPNQLFDNRCKFLTNQQRIFLTFLYRRLYGYGKTEIQLSYSVIFEDCPCIIKNKQKFSDMIGDLSTKGLIKIERGHKRCHTYSIAEEQYRNLVFWGERSKEKDYSLIQKDIENGITNNANTDNDISNFDINENTIETLIKVYQYEYKRLYPKSKCNITCNDRMNFALLKNELDQIPDIHYATFIRCNFLTDFYEKPKVDRIYDNAINNYRKYKDIVRQTPIEDRAMTWLYVNVYESYLLLEGKSIQEYINADKINKCKFDKIYYPELFYCSKTYVNFCKFINTEKRNDIIENIKKYPVIMNYVNNVLKDDSIFTEVEK